MSDTLIYNIIKKTIELRDATYDLNNDRDIILEMAKEGVSENNLNNPKFKPVLLKQEKSQVIITELFSLLDELDVLEGRSIKNLRE